MFPLTTIIFIALLGIFVGSLLNVIIYRLPRIMTRQETCGFSLWLPGSHCPQCRHKLVWYDNIPVLSWLILHGRCRRCRCNISLRYPLTEISSMLLCLLLALLIPPDKTLLAAWLLGWMLLALVAIDAEHQLLPDLLTLTLLWLGIFLQLCGWLPQVSLQQSVAGAIAGYLTLWLLAGCYRILRGKEGIGMGDAKLVAALGVWLGWQSLPVLLLLACGSTLVWLSFCSLIFRRSLKEPVPFGPGLAIAGMLLFIDANLSNDIRTAAALLFQI